MRGPDARQTNLFTFVSVEDRVPAAHPLRAVRSTANDVLSELSPALDRIYARAGRTAVPPEQTLRALLLWALYGVPSERRLLEELDYNLLFRWFVGLGLEDPIWPRETFRMNKRRVLATGAAGEFFARTTTRIRGRALIGNDHFSINWSLIEEWSGQRRLEDLAELDDESEDADIPDEAGIEPGETPV